MIDYQTISIVLTGIGLMIALTYYALQIRNQNKTRQAQLFMQIYNQFTNREFNKTLFSVYQFDIKNYEDFEHHNQIMSEFYTSFYSVAAFYEGVGILVKRKLIDPILIDDVMSGPLLYFWSKFAELVKEWRRRQKTPTTWEFVEYLYDSIKEIVEQQHGKEVADRFGFVQYPT